MTPDGAIVLGASYRALAVVRSLGRRGVRVRVARTDDHALACHSRYADDAIDLRGAEEERLQKLFGLGRGWALIPTGDEDAALLARHHGALAERFVVASSPWAQLRSAYDKRELHAVAARVGLAQPRTVTVLNGEVPRPPSPFPLAIKPAFKPAGRSLGGAKAWRVDGPVDLPPRWKQASLLMDPSILMLQELVPGSEQLSFAALCCEGRVCAGLTARRARQWPREFGEASTYVVSIDDASVERDARALLEAMGLTGIVEVEFKRHPGSGANMLLDVNPRAWGWLSIGERAGVDFPWLLWRQLCGQRIDGVRGRPGVGWVRLVTDVPAAAGDLRQRQLTARGYARSLRPPLACAVLAGDDPFPSLVNAALLAGVRAGRRWR